MKIDYISFLRRTFAACSLAGSGGLASGNEKEKRKMIKSKGRGWRTRRWYGEVEWWRGTRFFTGFRPFPSVHRTVLPPHPHDLKPSSSVRRYLLVYIYDCICVRVYERSYYVSENCHRCRCWSRLSSVDRVIYKASVRPPQVITSARPEPGFLPAHGHHATGTSGDFVRRILFIDLFFLFFFLCRRDP